MTAGGLSGRRLRHVDAIRGLAAIMVIVFHCCHTSLLAGVPLSGPERAFVHVAVGTVDLGKMGVILFFAISGFVIPSSLLKPSRAPARDFAIGRFFRMYPAYWLSIPAGVLALHASGAVLPSAGAIAVNATMLQQFLGVENLIGLYWTLQIELIFYGVCLATFLAGRLDDDRSILLVFASMLIVALAFAGLRSATGRSLPVALPLSLAVMFAGFLYRRGIVDRRPVAARALWIAGIAVAVLLPPICYLAYRDEVGVGASWQRYLVTYYAALSLFVLLNGPARITARVPAYLGTISYSIYLFGAVVQVLLEELTSIRQLPAPLCALIGATLALTIGTAAVVYRFIEAPSIALGRRMAARLDRAGPAQPDLEVV